MDSGANNLGSATFTVTADTTAFVSSLSTAEKQADKFGRSATSSFNALAVVPRQLAAINQSIMATTNGVHESVQAIGRLEQALLRVKAAERGGHGPGGGQMFAGAGMGLMMMAQTLDDLQYGFRAIVNNIPMVGMAIGQAFGMGTQAAQAFGGALGIVAVVVNQAITHWDELKATLGDTAPWEVVAGAIEKVKEALGGEEGASAMWVGGVAAMKAALGGGPDNPAARAHAVEMTKRKEEIEDAKARMEKFRTPEEQQRAKDFNAVLGEAGGPQKLIQDELNRRMATMKGLPPKAMTAFRDKLADDLTHAMGEGFKGKDVGGMFGADFAERMQGRAQDRALNQMNKMDAAGAKMRMHQEDLAKKQQKAAMEAQHRGEIWKLEDRRDELHRQRAAVSAERKPFTGDFFEFVKKVQESVIEQRKLRRLEEIKTELQRIDRTIKEKHREAARVS